MSVKILDVPGLTTAERNSISSAPDGALIYNTSDKTYNTTTDGATTWKTLTEYTDGTLLLTGSSGIYMTIDNGQWNMDMTVSGNPSTWQMSSDFYINFPYGSGSFNVNSPDDINLTSSGVVTGDGSINLTTNGSGVADIALHASRNINLLTPSSIQVGDYGEAATMNVTLSAGVVSVNTAGAPTLTLDGGSENTTLGGGNTTVSGNGSLTLSSASGTIDINSWDSIDLTTADANDERASQPINLITGSCDPTLGGDTGAITIKPGSAPDAVGGYILLQTGDSQMGGSINILTGAGDGTTNSINIETDPFTGTGGPITIRSDNHSVSVVSESAQVQCIAGSVNILGNSGISLNSSLIGMFGNSPVAQSTPIANATNSSDVITQLNTLLAYLRSRGDIDT